MSTISISGEFTSSINNSVTVTIIRPGEYFYSEEFTGDFSLTRNDLQPEKIYNVTFAGSSPGQFAYEITGNITVNPTTGRSNAGTIACGNTIQTT